MALSVFVHSHRTLSLPTPKWSCLCLCTLTELSRCLPPNGAVCVCALSQNSLAAYPPNGGRGSLRSPCSLESHGCLWFPFLSPLLFFHLVLLLFLSFYFFSDYDPFSWHFPENLQYFPWRDRLFVWLWVLLRSCSLFVWLWVLLRSCRFLYGSESCWGVVGGQCSLLPYSSAICRYAFG